MTWRLFIFIFITNFGLVHAKDIVKPRYKIEAELDTSNSTLTVLTKIDIPASLGLPNDTIWFHLWANAYSNTNNEFTKEQLSFGSTNFYFTKEIKLSKISDLIVKAGNQSLSYVFKDDGQEIVGVIIKDISSFNGNISFNYKLKLPYLRDGLGYRKGDYFLRNFYPKLAIYEENQWQVSQHRQFADEQGYRSVIELKLTTPGGFDFYTNGSIVLNDYFVTISATNILDLTVTMFSEKKRNISGILSYPNQKDIPFDIVVIDSSLYKDSLEKMVSGLEKSFKGMSEKFGPYPYEKLIIMIGEKCLNCFLSDGFVMEQAPEIIGKEIGYIGELLSEIWVRGNFNINTYHHNWIQSGLNEYYYQQFTITNNVVENKGEFTNFCVKNMYRNQRQRMVSPLNSTSDENIPEKEWIKKNKKSAAFFMYTDQLAGEENFIKALQQLSEKKVRITPDIFIKQFSIENGRSLDLPLKKYVYENPVTDYAINDLRNDDGFYSVIIQNRGPDSLPFILSFVENNGSLQEFFVDGRMGDFVVKTDIKSLDSFSIITIDKSGTLPEIERENNHYFPQRNSRRGPIKMIGLVSEGDTRRRDLRFMLAPAYNDNDGIMLGTSFSNSNINDPKTFRYAITPFYSFVNQKLLGQAWASYHQFMSNSNKIQSIEYRAGIKSFGMDRNRQLDYAQRYIRIDPSITIHFKHKGNKVKRSSLALKSFLISEEYPRQYVDKKFVGLENQNSYIHRMEYKFKSLSTLSSSNVFLALEQQSFEQKEHYLKLTVILDQRYMYADEKNIYIRGFASGFLINSQRESNSYQNLFSRGSIALIHQGHNDYTYDEYFFSRQNQNRTHDNFTSLAQGGGFKTPIGSAFSYGSSNHFAASINVSFDLPVLPLRAYFDAGSFSTYESIDQNMPEIKEFKNNFMYNAGFSFNVKDIFAIHIPIIYSEDLGNIYKGQHDTFFKRISFSLNLHKLDFWNEKDPFQD